MSEQPVTDATGADAADAADAAAAADAAGPPRPSRRAFLRRGTASAVGLGLLELVGSATADAQLAAGSPGQAPPRWGLLIDTARCAEGCDACVRACADEHGLAEAPDPLTDAQWIRKVELRERHSGREVSLPVLCQHCANAPCIDVCPTGASFRRADGIVLVDRHTCIGCRYCVLACPFKARVFVHEVLSDQLPHAPRGKGTAEGCTLCVHRLDAGGAQQPACVEACDASGQGAMLFGDLHDAEGPLASALRERPSRELRPDLRLGTGVRYQGL